MDNKMKWVGVPDNIEEYEGFVYMITHKATERYYIGKKSFWKRRTLPPLKGKTRKRHTIVESDWKNYLGSSNKLLADVEKYGKKNFERRIIHLCRSKFELSYKEIESQIRLKVLFDSLSYNEIINCRLRKPK